MPKDRNIAFSKLVKDVFGLVIQDYDFKYRDDNEQLIVAGKGEIEIIFRLEEIPLFYYFSLEIRLSGDTAKQATSDKRYRTLGVSTVTECLDPQYKSPLRGSQTESELRELMETSRDELLKYCSEILGGDVSSWQKVVDCVRKKKN